MHRDIEGSQVGGDDGNSCHEESEGGNEGPGAALWVHRVAVVCVAPGEQRGDKMLACYQDWS